MSPEAEEACEDAAFPRPKPYDSRAGQNGYDPGMKPMFLPDMYRTDPDKDDEDYDSETDEAMAYLAAVQNERQAIPALLIAPRPDSIEQDTPAKAEDQQDDDSTAEPTPQPDADEQEDYKHSVLAGFCQIREMLMQPPTEDEIADSQETVFISKVPNDNKQFMRCVRIVQYTAPTMLQIKDLSVETALELIERVIMRFHLRRSETIDRNVSLWLLLLLARLPGKDDLDKERVYTLRTLVHRLIEVRESIGHGNKGAMDDAEEERDVTTETTVDTVLLIVAELYSQWDMLEHRVWPPV